MKKLVIVVAASLSGSFGFTDEKTTELVKRTDKIVKDVLANPDAKHTDVIKAVWDACADEQEAAFCMYILRHEEEQVTIQEMFGKLAEEAPEAVGS